MARAHRPPKIGKNTRKMAQRLWFGMLITNLLGVFGAVMIAKRVRSYALDVDHEPIYLGVYYALMVLAALADAFWADEVFFRGAFRKTHLEGKTLAHAQKSQDPEAIGAALLPMNAIFPLLVVAGLAVSYALFNVINRGFNSDYSRVGRHALVVRDPHPDKASARLEALDALSMVQRPQVQLFLSKQLHHADDQTAARAAWAMGRIRNKNMRRLFSDELMTLARKGPPVVATEAKLALARMQHHGVGKLLVQQLEQGLLQPKTLDPRMVWALGMVQTPKAIDALTQALYHPDTQIQRIAAWALAQQKGRKNAERVLEIFKQRLASAPLPTRCALVHGLGILGHESGNLQILEAWNTSTQEERQRYCEPERVQLRPDHAGDDVHKLLLTPIKNTVETFDVMCLFSMGAIKAQTPEIKTKVLEWIESRNDEADTPLRSKDALRSLKAGIEAG